jgi:DNA-binding XRE family transcriptional regulator
MITLKSKLGFYRVIAKKGFSKRSLAREIGVSESTLIQVSNGKQSPRPDTAMKISKALEVDFDDIFDVVESH